MCNKVYIYNNHTNKSMRSIVKYIGCQYSYASMPAANTFTLIKHMDAIDEKGELIVVSIYEIPGVNRMIIGGKSVVILDSKQRAFILYDTMILPKHMDSAITHITYSKRKSRLDPFVSIHYFRDNTKKRIQLVPCSYISIDDLHELQEECKKDRLFPYEYTVIIDYKNSLQPLYSHM